MSHPSPENTNPMPALRRFLLRCAVMALLVVAMYATAEWAVRHYSTNPYKYKYEYITQHPQNIGTLILGSSHSFYDIDATLLGHDAFNLALPAQTWEYDWLLLEKYAPAMANLRNIVVEVGYQSLRQQPFNMHCTTALGINYMRYMDLPVPEASPWLKFEFMTPEHFSRKLQDLFCGHGPVYNAGGTYCDESPRLSAAEFELTACARAASSFTATKKYIDYNMLYLDRIINYGRQRGINIVFVSLPLSPQFLRHTDAEQMLEYQRITDSVARANNIPWLNLSEYPVPIAEFEDADHLTPAGARRITPLLRPYLK